MALLTERPRPVFRSWFGANRPIVGDGALSAPLLRVVFDHPFHIPFTQFYVVRTRCLLSVSPNVYEEAVWMVGVVVGLAG
jgi:hypothetical protein